MTFTEYQINHVLYPKFLQLDRDPEAFKKWAAETFPTAPKIDLHVIAILFKERAGPLEEEGHGDENFDFYVRMVVLMFIAAVIVIIGAYAP